jgi:hypothetical protein
MEVAILAVASATLLGTVILILLARADATTQQSIRDSADATKLAAESSQRTAIASHDIATRDYRRTCLHGLEQCLIELMPLVENFHVSAKTDDIKSAQARMSSYLHDISGPMTESREIADLDMPWANVSVLQGKAITARHEIHSALLGLMYLGESEP